jgi:hypothetical protein
MRWKTHLQCLRTRLRMPWWSCDCGGKRNGANWRHGTVITLTSLRGEIIMLKGHPVVFCNWRVVQILESKNQWKFLLYLYVRSTAETPGLSKHFNLKWFREQNSRILSKGTQKLQIYTKLSETSLEERTSLYHVITTRNGTSPGW